MGSGFGRRPPLGSESPFNDVRLERDRAPRAPGARASSYRYAMTGKRDAGLDWGRLGPVLVGIESGLTLSASCGKHRVPFHQVRDWMDNYPVVREAVEMAKLGRLARLEERLLDTGAKMPQVVSAIFALKNADSELWREDPTKGGSGTGLANNIVIVTGVPDRVSSGDDVKVIEGEVKRLERD